MQFDFAWRKYALLGAVLAVSSLTSAAAFADTTQDVNAGPIWNQGDAQVKCPVAAEATGGKWNGQWRTTVEGHMSVCGITHRTVTVDIPAGPIWDNDDAQDKCPVAAIAAHGNWNGQWRTTEDDNMSVCGVVLFQ